jgi:hypothetical protein
VATYKQIQDYVRSRHGHTVKTCWIAHVKEMSGLEPNRKSQQPRSNPCPTEKIEPIREGLRYFGMIECG